MFDLERREFLKFRDRLTSLPDVRDQMERAIEEVFWDYDTALRENRFVVGGAIEFIVGAALRACDVRVRHKGALKTDLDLILEENEKSGYSLKAVLKATNTRLINVMGAAPTLERWLTATIFLLSGVGLVYADPAIDWWALRGRQHVKVADDALEVSRKSIEAYAKANPGWLAPCLLPGLEERKKRLRPARTASADVAAQVLYHYPALFREWPGLRPWEEIAQPKG
ncbi:MAG: hypothetical protein NUW23_02350 [Firmicutes bacterium]|nr:hypothetical protein [Bacillota bacterium]